MNWSSWLKIIIILIASIFFLFGFLAGYFFGDKSCYENPFMYGIKELNEKYEDDIVCTCSSNLGKLKDFYFTGTEMKFDKYYNKYIKK